MQAAPAALSLILILLGHSGWTNGLCNLENGTAARCHELEDVKYIETYELESLKASVAEKTLSPGLFSNLSSLKHLDLSGGDMEKIDPGSFRKLVNLRSLDLADNRIEYLELASLDGLNHLRSLNLRKNNLRQLPPALARLKILRHLDVQGNPLQCNCATLRVRDLIVKRGVKISKKILCAGPNNMKGTSLLTPDTSIICAFEEQDRQMQRDQAYEGSGDELGSGDISDEFDGDEDEEGEEEDFVEVKETSSEAPNEINVETPFPKLPPVSTTTSSTETGIEETSQESTTGLDPTVNTISVTDSIEKVTDEDEELFFDSDDKKDGTSTVAQTTEKKPEYKDLLFYPVEGSGDEEEGSGEGSGTGMIFGETTSEKEDEPTLSGDSIFDMFFNAFWSTTAAPEEKKDPDLEEEQFIDASSPKEVDKDVMVRTTIRTIEKSGSIETSEATPSTTTETTTKFDSFAATDSSVKLVQSEVDMHESSKLGKVKASEESEIDELAEVSPARQSKKGMGSYVVLAALLAILATLIAFAAYKGDFCRKRRKRGDVENGTELKDMQKALLDTGNSTQPKIASNGNAENVPLVEDPHDQEPTKDPNGPRTIADVPKSPNGTTESLDPVKPPRRTASPMDDQKIDEKPRQETSSLKDDSMSARTSPVDRPIGGMSVNNVPTSRLTESNGPPLSPGAQRVKITLQENPDSVPRTPILITRTLAGENLVKAP